jgi:hypothetical protein
MSINHRVGWAFLWLSFTADLVAAAPVPILKVADLVSRADLIVMGRIEYVADDGPTFVQTPNGQVQARSMAGQIQVDHVFKGVLQGSTVRIRFALPDVPMGYRGVAPGSYRVVFLAGAGAPYAFVSPYHPSVIAQPAAKIVAVQALEGVFEAVGAVLLAPSSTSSERREAIDAMRGATVTNIRIPLTSALTDREPAVRLNAAAALLAVNDLTGLPLAVDALLRTDAALPDDVLLNLRAAISRGVSGDEAVPALRRLTQAGNPATRRAAATALGRIDSPPSVAILVRTLDDEDFDVRLSAARGLAQVTGQPNRTPSAEAFRADEQRIVRYWKEWAGQRR